MATVTGRRVSTVEEVVRPGDYCGPLTGYTGDKEACFFLLPTASGDNPLHRTEDANGLHHVTFPPHTYRECEDGSLEIRASIGAYGNNIENGYVWHGYLDEGHQWREC